MNAGNTRQSVIISAGAAELEGELNVPATARGLVLFVHGSGSSRHSPRNQQVARFLNQRGMATLLFDLLTKEEDEVDQLTRELRFDIELLVRRVLDALAWTEINPETRGFKKGLFGASTGTAAALRAAAIQPQSIAAVVSRSGRPDLAGDALGQVTAPVLLVVGASDPVVVDLNREALEKVAAFSKQLVAVPGATHLFAEPGTLEKAAEAASDWFSRFLSPKAAQKALEEPATF